MYSYVDFLIHVRAGSKMSAEAESSRSGKRRRSPVSKSFDWFPSHEKCYYKNTEKYQRNEKAKLDYIIYISLRV